MSDDFSPPPGYTDAQDESDIHLKVQEGVYRDDDEYNPPRVYDDDIEPPPYEAIAWEWSEQQRLGNHESAFPPQADNRDLSEMERRGRKLLFFSLGCFIIDLVIVVIGLANGRTIGPYSLANMAALVVFAIGVCNFATTSHIRRIQLAQAYFFVLIFVGLVGVGAGVYYTFTVPSRMAVYCESPDHHCDIGPALQVYAVSLSIVATLAWTIFFTVFTRSTFLYLVAAERARVAHAPGTTQISPLVHRIGFYLPHYRKHARNIGRMGGNAQEQCCRLCVCADGMWVYWFFFIYLFITVLALILCGVLERDSTAQRFWCLTGRVLFEFFIEVLANVN